MSMVARMRALGGDVLRDKWCMTLRPERDDLNDHHQARVLRSVGLLQRVSSRFHAHRR